MRHKPRVSQGLAAVGFKPTIHRDLFLRRLWSRCTRKWGLEGDRRQQNVVFQRKDLSNRRVTYVQAQRTKMSPQSRVEQLYALRRVLLRSKLQEHFTSSIPSARHGL